MSMVPALPVLPADMLRPVDIVNKFRPRSLAGLGYEGETLQDWGIYPDPETGLTDPNALYPTGSVGDQYNTCMAAGGASGDCASAVLATNPSAGDFWPTLTIPSTVSATASGRVNTSASDAATQAFVSQLLKQGFSLAQIATLQPGTVIQQGPGGTSTVLRQSAPGQTAVPVTLFGGGVSAAANQGASFAIVAAIAVGAFMLMNRR